MSVVVGIDPGISGGIAIWRNDRWTFYSKMPTRNISKTKKVIDGRTITKILNKETDIDLVVLESVGAMPKQGVTSTFNFGKGTGIILGVLESLAELSGLKYEEVNPRVWKKKILAGTNKDKEASIEYVTKRYNINIIPPKGRVSHDGIADAMCLAEYGRTKLR